MFGPEKMYRLTEQETNVMFDCNLDPNLTILLHYENKVTKNIRPTDIL